MRYTAKAFDVSHYQPPSKVDYAAAKADGYGLVIINFTDGVTPDPAAREHYRLAKAAGLLIGAYHYVHSDPTAAQQVEAFREATAGLTFDVKPWLDIEAPDVATRATRAYDMRCLPGSQFARATIYINLNDDQHCGHQKWMREHTLAQARYRAAGTAPPLSGAGVLPAWEHCYHQWTGNAKALAFEDYEEGLASLPAWEHCYHQWTGNGKVRWYRGEIDLIVYDPDKVPWIVNVVPEPLLPTKGTRLAEIGKMVSDARKALQAAEQAIEELEDEL